MSLTPAQQQVLDLLARRDPVVFDPDLPPHLTELLETGLAPLAERLGDEPLWVTKHALTSVHGCEAHHVAAHGTFEWSVPTVRGAVAHKAIELSIHWRDELVPAVLVDHAIDRLIDADRGPSTWLAGLDSGEAAELRSEATDLVAKFLECFPPLRPAWRPATESRVVTELLGGRVRLSGKVDLLIHGAPPGPDAHPLEARKVIIDLKSGLPVSGHREDLRFYALVDTLRVGRPPRLLATYYLDAARAQPEEVTVGLLEAAAHRVIDGAHLLVELERDGREPEVRPGSSCRWCPLLDTCAPGRAAHAVDDEP